METQIKLKRKSTAPPFICDRGGVYNNPIIKVQKSYHDYGKQLTLFFGFYASNEDTQSSLNFELTFANNSIDAVVDEETNKVLEWGYPTYNYLIAELIDFDNDGYPLLISAEGISWLINTPRVQIPNRLNESNLSNWEFINDETD